MSVGQGSIDKALIGIHCLLIYPIYECRTGSIDRTLMGISFLINIPYL